MSTRDDLAKSLYTGFIDYNEISLAEYQSKLLLNNSKRGQKVLTNIVSELNKCDDQKMRLYQGLIWTISTT